VTAAHPAAVRLDMVEQHLGLLKREEAVLRPTYNQQRGTFEAAAYVEPRPFVVIDGELGFATQGLRNNTDLRVFYGSHEPVAEWPEALVDDAEAYVESQRKWADMVVERMSSDSTEGEMVLTLRPTLPPLTLQALIEAAGEQHGMRLELARDMGLPVDRIVIDGAMSGQAAAHFEQRLLAELPVEFRQNATALGVVSGVQQRSESLALAQLVVALYWLKAAN